MQKVVLTIVIVFTCLPALLYAAGRGRGGKSGEHGGGHGEGNHRNCGPWTNGQCVPSNNATCGAGHQVKTRTGDNCPVKEKSVSCHMPCPSGESTTVATVAAAAAPAGRGKGGRKASKRCDYIKGDWSQCDSNNMRSRTFTLNTAAGEQHASCKQTKTIKKRCPKSRPNRGGGGRGEGRGGRGNQ